LRYSDWLVWGKPAVARPLGWLLGAAGCRAGGSRLPLINWQAGIVDDPDFGKLAARLRSMRPPHTRTTKIAKALGIGQASVYRVLEAARR
jgi:hypothetical protein